MMDRKRTRVGHVTAGILLLFVSSNIWAQQQPEPVDPTPQDGQIYALMNQASALQLAVNPSGKNSTLIETVRDLGSLAQRWALTRLNGGAWKLTDQSTGLCLTENLLVPGVQVEPCTASLLQNWVITEGANGYSTLKNAVSGRLLTESDSHGLLTTLVSRNPSQSQM